MNEIQEPGYHNSTPDWKKGGGLEPRTPRHQDTNLGSTPLDHAGFLKGMAKDGMFEPPGFPSFEDSNKK